MIHAAKKLIQLIITKTYQLTDLLKQFATCFEFFKNSKQPISISYSDRKLQIKYSKTLKNIAQTECLLRFSIWTS